MLISMQRPLKKQNKVEEVHTTVAQSVCEQTRTLGCNIDSRLTPVL